jgi:hypothetical protein
MGAEQTLDGLAYCGLVCAATRTSRGRSRRRGRSSVQVGPEARRTALPTC